MTPMLLLPVPQPGRSPNVNAATQSTTSAASRALFFIEAPLPETNHFLGLLKHHYNFRTNDEILPTRSYNAMS
jgi:hypothetical protein